MTCYLCSFTQLQLLRLLWNICFQQTDISEECRRLLNSPLDTRLKPKSWLLWHWAFLVNSFRLLKQGRRGLWLEPSCVHNHFCRTGGSLWPKYCCLLTRLWKPRWGTDGRVGFYRLQMGSRDFGVNVMSPPVGSTSTWLCISRVLTVLHWSHCVFFTIMFSFSELF